MKPSQILTLIFMSAGFLPGSYARQIIVNFSATVRSVEDTGNNLSGQVNPGDIFTGFYTYDTLTPDSDISESVADYIHTDPEYGISISLNGFTFKTDPSSTNFLIEMVNDYQGRDSHMLISYNNLFSSSASGTANNMISWQLDDPTMTALDSTALTEYPPNLADWALPQFGPGLDIWSQGSPFFFLIRSDITSISVIPEPSSYCFGVGIATGLWVILKRKRRLTVVPRHIVRI